MSKALRRAGFPPTKMIGTIYGCKKLFPIRDFSKWDGASNLDIKKDYERLIKQYDGPKIAKY